jgi:hypothetical protein
LWQSDEVNLKTTVRARLKPAEPPLQDFMVVICVVPTPGGLGGGPAWPEPYSVGYYQTLGVRVVPDRLRILLDSVALDGAIRWEEIEFERVNPNELDPSIQALAEPIEGEGIWYKSGRAYFSEW